MKRTYDALKKHVNRKGFGASSLPMVESLFAAATSILSECDRQPLISKVAGKSYFAFVGKAGRSRPINESLFEISPIESFNVFAQILKGNRRHLEAPEITSACYAVSIACCSAIDIVKKSDRKTQGTIFEWLCAAMMEAALNVVPKRSLPVLNLDLRGDLPTDFVFDLGEEKPKFHLPVKTSTRERIIQVWAHQRVLDGVYGVGRFLAMPIILTETKLDSKKNEVIEICLQWQWRLYQMHIANLWNVCYLDVPAPYLALDSVFPRVGVSTIGDLLVAGGRLDELLDTHGLGREKP